MDPGPHFENHLKQFQQKRNFINFLKEVLLNSTALVLAWVTNCRLSVSGSRLKVIYIMDLFFRRWTLRKSEVTLQDSCSVLSDKIKGKHQRTNCWQSSWVNVISIKPTGIEFTVILSRKKQKMLWWSMCHPHSVNFLCVFFLFVQSANITL